MFKKLQNKFLIINIVSIFTIFVIALGMIYSITYTNVQKENKTKLEQASNINLMVALDVTTQPEETLQEDNTIQTDYYTEKISPDFSVPFNIILDSNHKIIKINSYLDMTTNEYEELVKLALENKNTNIIKYKNKNWIYEITPLEEYGIREENVNEIAQTKIAFLDITQQVDSLNRLIFTLVGIAILMLVAIYFISLYFAKRAISPIKEAWEKQKQFIENASHELKTPVASIKANTDVLLLDDAQTIGQQIKWIEYIKLETNKISNLINKMLNLAKIENEEQKSIKKAFNLSETLENSIITMEALAVEKQIEVEKEIEKDIILVQEEEIIKQILQILLDNAFKYVNINGKIKVILVKEKAIIKLSIQNTGVGISKEDLPYIFDRFYKTDKARTNSDNSYGLGLSIAKIALEKIGGKIITESKPNELTTFTILLKDEKNISKKQQ
ncbi:MAG: sensor histidine kinase [Clostridia bacterium]